MKLPLWLEVASNVIPPTASPNSASAAPLSSETFRKSLGTQKVSFYCSRGLTDHFSFRVQNITQNIISCNI